MLPAGPTVTTGKLRRAILGGAISKPFCSADQVVDMYATLHKLNVDDGRDRQALDIAISGTTHLTRFLRLRGHLPLELVVWFLLQVALDRTLVRTGVCVYAVWLLMST